MNLLKELDQLPKYSIYGLFNEQDKKVYIGYAYDTVLALNRVLKDIKSSLFNKDNRNKDWDKLEFRIIESLTDSNDIKFKYQYWVNEYSNKGYEMYRNYKAITYKVKVDVIKDFRFDYKKNYFFRVTLVSGNGLINKVVAILEHKDKLDDFLLRHYPKHKSIINIVTHSNNLTKLYLEKYG